METAHKPIFKFATKNRYTEHYFVYKLFCTNFYAISIEKGHQTIEYKKEKTTEHKK